MRTWTIGTQIWSDALAKAQPGCIASTDLGTTTPPTTAMYRSSGLYSGSGYLYNWKCVSEQATNLCPTPWRVPTSADFCELDKALFITTTCLNRADILPSTTTATYVAAWGGVYGGLADGLSVYFTGGFALYWTSSSRDAGLAYSFAYLSNQIYPQRTSIKSYGLQIRCVLSL
jgi:uncharacterized protein (TIGR02145 family)